MLNDRKSLAKFMEHIGTFGVKNMFKNILLMLLLIMASNQAWAESKTTFYHYDLLGSPVATTDQDGNVLWREEYSPWGEKLLKQDVNKDNVRGYTGHVHDEETGLTYMQARYYDPQIGRFMGIDPVGFQESNSISFNRYGYANNNPFKFTDPNGEEADDHVGGDFGDPIGFGNDDMSDAHEMSSFFDDMENEGIQGGGPMSVVETAAGGLKLGIIGAKIVSGAISNAKRAKEVAEVAFKAKKNPYGHLKDHPSVAPGKIFTSSAKQKMIKENMRRNKGTLKSDLSGKTLVAAKQHKRGVTPPNNEAHVDHIKERSIGGSNSFTNGRVLSREENLSRPGR